MLPFSIRPGAAIVACSIGMFVAAACSGPAATPAAALKATQSASPAAAPASSPGAVQPGAPAASPVATAVSSPAAPPSVSAPAASGSRVNANTATIPQLQAAFETAGISNAARWAREVDEYRPYPADDPNWGKLRRELAKYNPAPDVLEKIIATLTL